MRSRLLLLTVMLYYCITSNAQTVDSLKYTIATANEFHKGYTGNHNSVLIDSRDYKDYRKSRIPGAVNIEWPIPEEYFSGSDAPAKDKSLYIYCYAGNRSKKVSIIYYDHGYRNIYSLKGGFNGWRLNKMPVDKKRLKKI